MRQLLTDPQLRIARQVSVCCEPGCLGLLWPGHVIVKRPGGGWRHQDCSRPGRRRKDKAAAGMT